MARKTDKATKHNPPAGWFISGSKPDHYETGVDTSVPHSGTRCAYMKNAVIQPDEFGTLMQECSPGDYLGKRVRMTSWIKSERVQGWVGAWMSVYGKEGRINVSFDNMCNRKITGTTDWTKYEIVLDVPRESTKIAFGVILCGKGKLWFDDVAFDVVSNDVKISDCPCSERHQTSEKVEQPKNLDFEQEN